MKNDEYGFRYAYIDREKCINCGKCQSVCPTLVQYNLADGDKNAYAIVSLDETAKMSASGGIFAITAKRFIENGGVVFGTAFTEDLKVRVIGIQDVNDLHLLQGSKYVQSDMSTAYSEIKQFLDIGKRVLFAGTPCQTSALKNLFGKSEQLYLIDIICHGTPNAQMFDESVAALETKYSKKIVDFSFRDAEYGHRMIGSITFEDKKKKKLPAVSYPYYSLFLKNSIITPACHSCNYAKIARVSDITIGDYWGVHKQEKDFYMECVKKGVPRISAIMINSTQGSYLFDTIKDSVFYKKSDINKIKLQNPSLYAPTKPNKDREKCLNIYKDGGYEALSIYYKKKYAKINIKARLYAALPNSLVSLLKKWR